MNRVDLGRLAHDRIVDAKLLLAAKRWTGAYYLAGYALECALKACIAKQMKPEEFPDRGFAEKCWTHNLPQLLGLAGLKSHMDSDVRNDQELFDNWTIVKDWNEASRYARLSRADAEAIYTAITDKKHGILPWLKARW